MIKPYGSDGPAYTDIQTEVTRQAVGEPRESAGVRYPPPAQERGMRRAKAKDS
jgi:hypothetical protein